MASARTIGRLHEEERNSAPSAEIQPPVKSKKFLNSLPAREERIRARFRIEREREEPQPGYDAAQLMSILTDSAPASGDRFAALRMQERFAQFVRTGRFRAGGHGGAGWAGGPPIQI